jgi:cell fate (sporulation/competence/biofilm development) regulator YlbF (YheA/YmcA/DUF963 family)
MELNLDTAAVLEKTRELCQTIVDQPGFQAARGHLDAFLADEEARRQYQSVAQRGQELQARQYQGLRLSQEELANYETEREALENNPIARNFLEAQEQIHQVQGTITRYVTKTLELGRVPNPDDFETCSPGCACGH